MTANAEEFGTGWDDDGGPGKWLKLKDGDEAVINVYGKARKFEKDWGDGKPSQRWAVDVYNTDSGVIQEFEFGYKVFKSIRAVKDRLEKKGSSLPDHVLCVSRTGSGKNDTSYIVSPEGALSAEQREARDAAIAARAEAQAETPEEDIPF